MTSAPILRHLAFEDTLFLGPVLPSAGDLLREMKAVDPLPTPVEPSPTTVLPDFERWRSGQSAERARIAPEALRREARADGSVRRIAGQATPEHRLRELDA
ncbi:hypothetical protein EBL89_13450 [Cereibacter sphaeroides]|uniref:hypothetical protein n=1 Tax=Cereibacter sphaeroides TaxID=1063 RepID=UPI000F52E862|nr:hypothetical protein [Cereibacter sphaeroides]AZB56260.1 hypothetical protein EBL89_13450 [Cereibacter sphaeroides]AZB60517.1 hypothetical protein EBL88_13330 [Cereibacter sphaeroides]